MRRDSAAGSDLVNAPFLELRSVTYGYSGIAVLDGVDFSLCAGERVALTGANGAGKTTLLQVLLGLRKVHGGVVKAFGAHCRSEADFVSVRARVGLLFQDSDDQLFCPTVLEDVAFGPLNLGYRKRDAVSDAMHILESLGLQDFAHRLTHRLSGGEKRLVALATVLVMNPEVLLLDEPTNGLDENAAHKLLSHLDGLKQSMVLVSHDRQVLSRLASRAVRLDAGKLADVTLESVLDHSPGRDHGDKGSSIELVDTVLCCAGN